MKIIKDVTLEENKIVVEKDEVDLVTREEFNRVAEHVTCLGDRVFDMKSDLILLKSLWRALRRISELEAK